MEVEKCAVCGSPIVYGDEVVAFLDGPGVARLNGKRVLFDNDDSIHAACWDKVAVWEKAEGAENDHDSKNRLICPACKEPLLPGQFAKRSAAFILHSSCPESY